MSRKIVILDSYPVNPGDLSWDAIAALGEFTAYEHCPNDNVEILRRCKGAEIVMTNKVGFTAEMMDSLPELGLIALQSTGYNIVDIEAAKQRGIVVCNVPGYSTDAVAQMTFAFILELYSGVSEYNDAVKSGDWCKAPDFTFYARPILEVSGKTLGILGFGSIGQKVARIGKEFGMNVIYHSRTPKNVDFARCVSIEELFRESDLLSLHAPMTPETKKIVNKTTIELMKSSACLINTARGGLVDEMALAEALNTSRIAGAGIDVLSEEPPPENNPLLHAKNCLVTPHVAWASIDSRRRLMNILEENIKAYIAGKPINQVNK